MWGLFPIVIFKTWYIKYMDQRTKRRHVRKHTDPKLKRNLRIFLVIFVILLSFVVYETTRDGASPWQVGTGLLIGVIAGALTSRMYKISWNQEAQQVTSNFDLYGVLIIGLYILFSLSRTHIAELFAGSESIASASLALLTGTMYGRVLGSGWAIFRILKQQQIFSGK